MLRAPARRATACDELSRPRATAAGPRPEPPLSIRSRQFLLGEARCTNLSSPRFPCLALPVHFLPPREGVGTRPRLLEDVDKRRLDFVEHLIEGEVSLYCATRVPAQGIGKCAVVEQSP